MNHSIALVLLRSGQLPLPRFIELARENGWPLPQEPRAMSAMTDPRPLLRKLADDAYQRGMTDLAQAYTEQAVKHSTARVAAALKRLDEAIQRKSQG